MTTALDILKRAENPPKEIFDAELLWDRIVKVLKHRPGSTFKLPSETQFSFVRTRAQNEGYEVTPVVMVPETFARRFGIIDNKTRKRITIELPLEHQ